MRILYIYTDYFCNYDIPLTLKKMGCTFDSLDIQFFTYEYKKQDIDLLSANLSNNQYDFVFSYGYVPYISDLCEAMSVYYVAWTYDSILHALYTPSIENPHNVLFIYDNSEYRYLKTHYNIPLLYHLPLAANIDRIKAIPHIKHESSLFANDISFVGTLYQQNTYVDLEPMLSEEERNYFETAFSYFHGKWATESIYQWFSKDDADYLQHRLPDYLKNDGSLPNHLYFADILLSKPIGSRERIDALNQLAGISTTRLYTKSDTDTSVLTNVNIGPYVNYYDDMYRVFRNSKINLNMTLHGMMSGIPLRCFDILAAGGFLLSNYQEELPELFTPDVSYVQYTSIEELKDKATYYLKNEPARARIAQAGKEAIEAGHTYQHRLGDMLQILKNI